MYSKYLHTKSTQKGTGVFTKISIPANAVILEFTGDIIPKEQTTFQPSDVLQVGSNRVIGPSGAIDDFINHSCNPNCLVYIVGNRAFLYSLYEIPVNSELTFDYSTSSTDLISEWRMDCKCGSYNCRKTISGFQYLDEDLKKEYIQKGMVPVFITNPNFYQKKW